MFTEHPGPTPLGAASRGADEGDALTVQLEAVGLQSVTDLDQRALGQEGHQGWEGCRIDRGQGCDLFRGEPECLAERVVLYAARAPELRPKERTSRSISRILSASLPAQGDHPSATAVASGLVRSTRKLGEQPTNVSAGARERTLVILLRVGFTEPSQSPGMLVVSYTTVSPLPRPSALTSSANDGAVCFLWHCPAGRPGWALPTTVLCGVRTFLGPSGEEGTATT
jgi:hypothetical protein